MNTVNEGFDADPREIPYGEAEERLTTLSGNVSTWAESVGALTAPPGFEQPQTDMTANTGAMPVQNIWNRSGHWLIGTLLPLTSRHK